MSKNNKRHRGDVHIGSYLNPLVSKELNQKDPQIKDMLTKTQVVDTMDKGDADNFLDKYAK